MKKIFILIIVNVVVYYKLSCYGCLPEFPKINTKTKEKEMCVIDGFHPLDELTLCFKPGSSFKSLKILGFPNFNFSSFYSLAFFLSNLRVDDLDHFSNDLYLYETIDVERMMTNEWNYLHIQYEQVPLPNDNETTLKIFTRTLNNEEYKFKIPRYIIVDHFQDNIIFFIFEGEWEGSRNFSGMEINDKIQTPHNISNCDGIEIPKYSQDLNETVRDELVSNKPGIIAACVSASVVGLIFILSVLIYMRIKKSRIKKENDYYEQYPEEYEHYESPPSLGPKVDLHDKKTNLDDKQENFYEEEALYDQLENVMEDLKINLEDETHKSDLEKTTERLEGTDGLISKIE